MKKLKPALITVVMGITFVSMLLLSNAAFAIWTSYEYRDSSGEYRYGIKDGSSKVELDLKKRKQADKTAKAMNKADKIDKKG